MKRISSRLAFFWLFFWCTGPVMAGAPTSFRQPHPLDWMHAMPTGEMPGWSDELWLNFEVSSSNIWNAPLKMQDRRNGRFLEYTADFEQVSTILELGGALNKGIAAAVELPFAYREGGLLDHFIDQFHQLMRFRRYNRQYYGTYDYEYSVVTDGKDYYAHQNHLRGLANVKPKIKFWLWRWENKKTGCACGFAVSAQVKVPVQKKSYAGTSGSVDAYYLAHLGIPLWDFGAMWMTAAYSYLGDNPAFDTWPRLRKYWMYELSMDISLSDRWGLLLLGRAESPYLDHSKLSYENTSSDPKVIDRDRAASGWNSLVRWRGAEAIGVRYRPTPQMQFSLLMAEDWGVGPYDSSGDFYSNGAPDVNFIFQSNFGF